MRVPVERSDHGVAAPHLPFPRGEEDWRIDSRTREAARHGIADARAALDRCQRPRNPQRAHRPRGGQR